MICFKCLLHMKEHLYKVIPVTFMEISSRLNGTWKNISKESTYIMLVPSQTYKDFWQLLQNPKVPKIVQEFSNHTQRFTTPYYSDQDNPFEFWVLSLLEFFLVLSQIDILIFVTIWGSLKVVSPFEFFSFITICIFEFHHNLSFWV